MSTSTSAAIVGAETIAVRGRNWLPFLIGFGLLWGTLALLGEIGAGGLWPVGVLLAVAAVAVLVDRLIVRTLWRRSVRNLGLTRPGWRPVALAAAVSALVLLVFPLTTLVTGAGLGLERDWPVILIGVIAFNGLAEEIIWRGYTFRRLRVGRSFARTVLLTMPLVAVSHIPIIIGNGLVVGIGAMLVAAVTSIPFAYLYETGRGTIWAPAVLHSAIDSFKVVVMPASAAMTFSLLLISVSLTVPLLVLVVRRRALTAPRTVDA